MEALRPPRSFLVAVDAERRSEAAVLQAHCLAQQWDLEVDYLHVQRDFQGSETEFRFGLLDESLDAQAKLAKQRVGQELDAISVEQGWPERLSESLRLQRGDVLPTLLGETSKGTFEGLLLGRHYQ